MPSIKTSVRAYEKWLKAEVGPDFVGADLKEKHRKMRSGPFPFLRATYWRWAEQILDVRPGLAEAPRVLAIGDTHLENFGTWRDADGRLIWGANDFDEAAVMPYPLDIVRLATSAVLAGKRKGPSVDDICNAVLSGYTKGLADPQPIVLERDHKWLRRAIVVPEKERSKFWKKMTLPDDRSVPVRFRGVLEAAMPDRVPTCSVAPRTAGTGSLGRPRFIAMANWRGGPVLREAKVVVMSAWSRTHAPQDRVIRAQDIACGRYRAPDPHHHVADGILIRRLSLNSRKIEADDDAEILLSARMLKMMGREIANCHANVSECLPAIRADLELRNGDWLRRETEAAVKHVERNFAAYAR